MRTKYLTREEKLLGQKHYNRFQKLNGAGYNFLGDTIVYLLAIYFGASNIQLGYISSAGFLMGIFLPVIPRLVRGKNLVTLQAISWLFRGLAGLGYGLLFFFSGEQAVWLILFLYSCFSLFRLVGVVVINPLINHISSSGNRGQIIAQVNISFQSVSILAKIVSAIIISIQQLSGYIGLIFIEILGFLVNSLSVVQLRKVPCRATVETVKGRNLFVLFKEAMKKRNERIVLFLVWLNVMMFVLLGLIIPFLRKEFGFENYLVILYSALSGISFVLASMYTKAVGDRIGSRPFLLVGGMILLVCLLGWILIPVSISPVVVFILGFFTSFFLFSNNLFISRLLLLQIPEDEGFVYNTMSNFCIAIISLISGIAGGLLIDIGTTHYAQWITIPIGNNHLLLFGFTILITFVMLLLALQIKETEGDTSASASMLFSFQGLKAYVDISRLEKIKNPIKKKTVLFAISDNANGMATDEIKKLMASPLSSDKTPVLQSLFHHRRPSLLRPLIDIALDPDSYHQLEAVFALGAYRNEASKDALLEIFNTYEDPRFRSSAAKALGRIGNREIVDEVKELLSLDNPIWVQMNYIIALKNMDVRSLFKEGLFRALEKGRSRTYRQTIYSLYAKIMNFSPSLSEIYQGRNTRQGKGLREFLEDARDTNEVFESYDKLNRWFIDEEWSELVRWCITSVEDKRLKGVEESIRQAVLSTDSLKDSFDYDDALACFYFSYQIMR